MIYMSSLFASLHYLALALGLGGLFMRGRYLRTLLTEPTQLKALPSLFAADNFWGIAAILWVITGLMRAFGGIEKGTAFYLSSPLFWVKMALFGVIGALEVFPMMTFISWRIAHKKGEKLKKWQHLNKFRMINDVELIIVVALPFIASAMARAIDRN